MDSVPEHIKRLLAAKHAEMLLLKMEQYKFKTPVPPSPINSTVRDLK